MNKKRSPNVICESRKARFNYELLDFYEGGLVLEGSEVKSIRAGQVQINEAYASFSKGELWLIGAHIAKYDHAATGTGHDDERRSRKILLHESELKRLREGGHQGGLTVVPLKLKWVRGKVKVELALARGKKTFDKRATIKEREQKRSLQRIFKGG
ncbi:MAG: SsrA-binding protein [Alphaproteobacteria bacterium CG_4_10_14_0_8_um_filter_53_9]|nr:MAG: SsrA-binding protein [Alphaproteobacteria bacterium CG_4_10_14_0_8_um_filter_53_9]